jgi:hypothetical protein
MLTLGMRASVKLTLVSLETPMLVLVRSPFESSTEVQSIPREKLAISRSAPGPRRYPPISCQVSGSDLKP